MLLPKILSASITALVTALLIGCPYSATTYAQTSRPVNPFQPSLVLRAPQKGYQENSIFVSPSSYTSPYTPQLTQYKLNHVPVAEVKDALQNLCSTGKLSAEPLSNTLFFIGPLGESQQIKKALASIDLPTKQVTLEAKVISLNNEASKNLGVNWHWEPIPQYNSDDNSSSTTSGRFRFYRSNSLRFGATLNALIAKGKAKILASPHIITLPGKTGHIFIGDHIPYQVEKHDGSGNYSTTEYIDAGISLKYTPIINVDTDMITASVHTEVSTPTLVAELKNYKVTSRKVATTVRMFSGETLVIGGLVTQEEQRTLQKVPFLGDIPLLGNLFKNSTHTKNRTEILLLLTPHISEPGKSPAIYEARSTRLQQTTINP